MSLPPALLARLAQRGLVQKLAAETVATAENEEVIAEDYDDDVDEEEVSRSKEKDKVRRNRKDDDDGDNQDDDDDDMSENHSDGPEAYAEKRDSKRVATKGSFWLERMKRRMGEATEMGGYRGCPNKYNIWHKCTSYCVNRWGDGIAEPSREYMRRYKRLRRKYPLPKGWTEMYDPGCGCFYFYSATENLVSWLPPTHPKAQVGRTAAYLRRQLEENGGSGSGDGDGSDGEPINDDNDEDVNDDGDDDDIDGEQLDERENRDTRQRRKSDDINASVRPSYHHSTLASKQQLPSMAPQDFPSLEESVASAVTSSMSSRKGNKRDADWHYNATRRDHRGRHDRHGSGGRYNRKEDALDPMDPSAYSDLPRGKWSDGLAHQDGERGKKTATTGNAGSSISDTDVSRERERKKRRTSHSDEEDDDDDENDENHD